jgi:hypothetical protein
MSPLLLLGLPVALFLIAGGKSGSSSSSSAGAKVPTPAKKTVSDFQTQIAEAISRGDADALMNIANDMQSAGLVAEASALRATATGLRQLGALPGAGGSPGGSPVLTPSAAVPNPPFSGGGVTLPPIIIPSSVPLPAGVSLTPESQKRLAVAQAVAMNLRNTSRYQEDKTLMKAFQTQEQAIGKYVGTIDGLYGPKSGYALAGYGVVPPRPRYWSTKTVKVDKPQWTAKMLAFAASDPSRAADWTAASKVASDPVA